MPEPLEPALAEIRELLLDPDNLVRAVAAGRRRGHTPSVARAEVRPVRLRPGQRMQVVTSDGSRPTTRNLPYGPRAQSAVDALLAEPFGSWRVETTGVTLQLRVTRGGAAQVHRGPGVAPTSGEHDRPSRHLLDPGDSLYEVIGGDAAKRRQVDAFLRALSATLPDKAATLPDKAATLPDEEATLPDEEATLPDEEATLPDEDPPPPLRVVDLGCGNAYLTFAAYRWLTATRGLDVHLVGVDIRDDQRERNTELAARLGWQDRVRFVAATILTADLPEPPDVVLALHACDTATDEALARAVDWRARVVLAAPCCHHDVAAQLRRAAPPDPYQALTRYGILRERFADVLTDTLRAALLRRHGYRVEVVEFIESRHTPRNVLLRAVRTAAPPAPSPYRSQEREYEDLVAAWSVTPHLARLLA